MVADHGSGEAGEVDALYAKPFSDFKLDFSDVEIPKGPISEDEAEDLADRFYASLTK